MKTLNLFGLMITAACTFQACQSPDSRTAGGDSTSTDTAQTPQDTTGMVADTGLKASDKEEMKTGKPTYQSKVDSDEATFLKEAAIGGMMEVELGKLAQQSARPEVKAFAAQMVTDHTKANNELKALASEKKILLPAAYPADVKAHIDMMKKMDGTAFDKHYIDMMVNDHDKTVTLFKGGQQSQTKEVKDFAEKTLPVIMEHYKKAKAIQSTLQ
ncbi:DUF4142 domain-containing protein [Pedobacter sp. AW31-3R]|uniref:DUF4142 domain-containing protein n=1 Tax=Pedobacter sp. AW31-3R TaxID=3445781 RepID=UPI003F9F53AB